jgi:branched-chain amino acid transport system permease protein
MGTFIVAGLVSGVIYGLAAVGLVMVYKGSRVFNFAQGEFGTVGMFVLFYFVESLSLPYPVAVLIALAAGALMGLLTERLVVRPLGSAPRVIALVGTAGIALFAIGMELVIGGVTLRSVRPLIPGTGLTLMGVEISAQRILSLVAVIGIAIIAAYFFQRTFFGMGILANSQDTTAARIVGANVNRISALTWGIAGALGALAGVLLGPQVPFYPGYMTTIILIPAFTAAILGGMTSLPGAFIAGELVGLIESFGRYVIRQSPALSNVPEGSTVLLFLLLVIVLAIRPQGLFGSEA